MVISGFFASFQIHNPILKKGQGKTCPKLKIQDSFENEKLL